MLFNIKPVKTIGEVKKEINKIVARQKPNTPYDLAPFKNEIEELLSSFSEFNPDWKKVPVVFRVARIENKDLGTATTYLESVVLPDTKHDLELMMKMLNHIREEKKLKTAGMPLFVQPDELSLAYKEGKIPFPSERILSQLVVVFQKGAIMFVGFIFGKNYVLLQG